LYAEYLKIILTDQSLTFDDDLNVCLTYIKEIFPEHRSIYSTINNGAKIDIEGLNQKLLKLSIGKKVEKRLKDMDELVFDIERRTLRLAQRTNLTIKLFLDDLDSDYENSKKYIDSIKILIIAISEINDQFRQLRAKSKILIILRNDILNFINSPNIGKIKRDAKIEIEWPAKISLSTPVVKMMLHKIRISLDIPKKVDNESLYRSIFVETVYGDEAYKYILDRTMIRPRDVISYLKFIIEDYPEAEKITSKMILDTERKYSEYLKEEIKNEMYGSFPEEYIDSVFMLLKSLKLSDFSYMHIKTAYDENAALLEIDNFDSCLNNMFEYGIIGNNTSRGYHFKYRDNDSFFLRNEQIVLHRGLLKEICR